MPAYNPRIWLAFAIAVVSPIQAFAGSFAPAESEPSLVEAAPAKPDKGVFDGFSVYAGISSATSNYDININTRILGFENTLNLPDLGGQGYGATVGLGYDRMLADNLLAGLFVDYQHARTTNDYRGASAVGDYTSSTSYTLSQDYLATIGARFGRTLSEETLLYGIVGYSAARFSGAASYGINDGGSTLTNGASHYDFYNMGITLGVGIETSISKNTFVKLEARETKFKGYDLFQLGDQSDPASMSGSADHGSRNVSLSIVRRF